MKFSKFEFKKSKYPIMKICFITLIIFSLFSIVSIFHFNKNSFYISGYSSFLAQVSINVTLKQKQDNGLFACINENCESFSMDNHKNVHTLSLRINDEPFYNVETQKIAIGSIFDSDKLYKNIENISIGVGAKDFYFDSKDISRFETKKLKMKYKKNGEDKEYEAQYNAIILPSIITDNNKGLFNKFCVSFLALFYNWHLFVIPYFWLFVAFLIYNYKKDEINIKINLPKNTYWVIFGLIAILGLLLRLNLFTYYPLWIDEIYTKTVAISSFKACFSDPGNPPLFYILELIFTKIFKTSDVALRFLPLVFSLGLPYIIYFIFKKIDKNIALFAFFLASINTVSIYFASEARSYSLSMLLAGLMVYFLFNYLKDFKKNDLIAYSITAICALNTYFYLAVLAFSNFIWGVVSLFEDDNKDKIKPFIISNLLIGLTFIPYLIYSFKGSIDTGFNSWIAKLDITTYKFIIDEFFINKYIFLFLAIVLLIMLILSLLDEKYLAKLNLKKDENKETLFIYLIYSLAFCLVIISLFSICIKPILHKRLLLSLYSIFLMLQAVSILTIFNFKTLTKNTKVIKVVFVSLFLALTFAITKPMNTKEIYRLDPYMHFMLADSKSYHNKGYEIHALVAAKEEYLSHFLKDDTYNYIIWHFTDITQGDSKIKFIKKEDYIKSDKPAIFYVSSLAADIGIASYFHPNYYPYITNTSPNNFTKVVFDK